MQKPNDSEDYDLRDEYDLSTMPVVAKGRYAPERRAGSNIIVLAPELSRAFPTDESVNEALRLVLKMADLPRRPSKRAAKGR